jgi:crotonobetainyl-CoA:carnitine CoA-transferase CaiB-like acyl-CoA transferase
VNSALPLNGITVVALEQAVAGPLATRHLADLGARAPGVVERLGLDGDTLRATDPRLVVVDISGYGTSGPRKERKALRHAHPGRVRDGLRDGHAYRYCCRRPVLPAVDG